jgi:hypothetical protein
MSELERLIQEQRRDDTRTQYPEFGSLCVPIDAFKDEDEVLDSNGRFRRSHGQKLQNPRPRTTTRKRSTTSEQRRAQYRDSKRRRYHGDVRERQLERMRLYRARMKATPTEGIER